MFMARWIQGNDFTIKLGIVVDIRYVKGYHILILYTASLVNICVPRHNFISSKFDGCIFVLLQIMQICCQQYFAHTTPCFHRDIGINP